MKSTFICLFCFSLSYLLYNYFLLAGRWTAEEHKLFLQGLQLYNKQWKQIADLVKTRTVVQIRTHAQKYFQKLEKSKKNSQLSEQGFLHGPRADSISSADSVDSLACTTNSESESDNEKIQNSSELIFSGDLKLPLPTLLQTKPSKSSKSSESPRKRSRESKSNDSKKSSQKSSKQKNSFTMFEDDFFGHIDIDTDPLMDFAPIPGFMDELEDIDENIVTLLEKIDWAHDSRSCSPIDMKFTERFHHFDSNSNYGKSLDPLSLINFPLTVDEPKSSLVTDSVDSTVYPSTSSQFSSLQVFSNQQEYMDISNNPHSVFENDHLHLQNSDLNISCISITNSIGSPSRKRGRPRKLSLDETDEFELDIMLESNC